MTPYPQLQLPVFQPPTLSPAEGAPAASPAYPGATVQAFANPYPWGNPYNGRIYAPMTNNPGTRMGLAFAQAPPGLRRAAAAAFFAGFSLTFAPQPPSRRPLLRAARLTRRPRRQLPSSGSCRLVCLRRRRTTFRRRRLWTVI
jgi:hypothetical protein